MILSRAIDWVERGRVPDGITRIGIRTLVRNRAREQSRRHADPEELERFLSAMADSPLASGTADANEQHYEVPTEFYRLVLGPRLKYSCAWFDTPDDSLAVAEENMLRLSVERAGIVDGMSVLDLGCGWGSMSLYLAEHYPGCDIVAVSNSTTQKEHIDRVAADRGVGNVVVMTADMNDFDIDRRFDRIVSIEMFEHMRNHGLLFERIARWLAPDGKLFFHIFCHRNFPYFFEPRSDADWMAKNFFTGGLMPCWDLPLLAQDTLALEDRWVVCGRHYAQTCRHWLEACDGQRSAVLAALARGDSPAPPDIQLHRWRMFFMACEELFAHCGGNEWHVGHYRFGKS